MRTLVAAVASLLAVALLGAVALLSLARPAAPVEERRAADELLVAAAADLQLAFGELGRAFAAATGAEVRCTFGSSGQLAEQIVNGAPYDLFASANVAFVDEVIAAGRGVAATKVTYAYGRIVLWSPRVRYRSLADLLDPRIRYVAIPNPEHAPYGRAAEQALRHAGVYARVKRKLVYGESVADALRLVRSGNADVGIVALSLAVGSGGRYTEIAPHRYEPLEQALVVTASGERRALARRFARFVTSEEGRSVLRRYGFLLPGERRGLS
ncbi:MAG: molybdate ABC transporter substrate-binding protein [Thermoleophilia bacterium]|nr:molybdate ABC transporter substrate-binding protein [Thermoleophilia bacterium]